MPKIIIKYKGKYALYTTVADGLVSGFMSKDKIHKRLCDEVCCFQFMNQFHPETVKKFIEERSTYPLSEYLAPMLFNGTKKDVIEELTEAGIDHKDAIAMVEKILKRLEAEWDKKESGETWKQYRKRLGEK